MRVFATLKPNDFSQRDHLYGVLAEIDWDERRIVRQLRIPTASFKGRSAFMAPSANGLVVDDDRIFVAMWNFVAVVDRETFTVVDAFSDRYMADNHGMTTDGEHLWLVSTALEAVLCYSLDDLSLQWRWGPDEPILETRAPSWPPKEAARTVRRRRSSPDVEFRHVHKSRSVFRRHHMNDVRWHDGRLYVTTHHWFDDPRGAVIGLDPATRRAEFVAPPGSFAGMHDGELVDGRFVVTESGANSVGWLGADGRIEHRRVEPSPFFVRGLCRSDGGFLVGYSRKRTARGPSWIVEWDDGFADERGRMALDGPYPDHIGTAVHALVPAG